MPFRVRVASHDSYSCSPLPAFELRAADCLGPGAVEPIPFRFRRRRRMDYTKNFVEPLRTKGRASDKALNSNMTLGSRRYLDSDLPNPWPLSVDQMPCSKTWHSDRKGLTMRTRVLRSYLQLGAPSRVKLCHWGD